MRLVVDPAVPTDFIVVSEHRLNTRADAERFIRILRSQMNELWPKRKPKKAEQS